MTRREWGALFVAAPLAAQVTTTTNAPMSAPPQKLEKATADVRQTSETLRGIQVPMNVEPAFSFRA